MPETSYQRIISLVPSLTELLIDLGLKNKLVGRTRFCIHPENELKEIEIIGGTKNPNLERIAELKPDFILANKEENRKQDIDVLDRYAHVKLTDIETIEDALMEINSLGALLDVPDAAQTLTSKITALLSDIPDEQPLSVAYLIWKDPWMTIGNDTYIHHVLDRYHLKNAFGDQNRYPKTSLEELRSKNPDLILLSSEPYPFKEKHIEEVKDACPAVKIKWVNGEWFSWYGSRMIGSFEALNRWRKTL